MSQPKRQPAAAIGCRLVPKPRPLPSRRGLLNLPFLTFQSVVA